LKDTLHAINPAAMAAKTRRENKRFIFQLLVTIHYNEVRKKPHTLSTIGAI
jgi:hypothetical protein